MTATISRDELKAKLDRGDKFRLVETLAEDKFREEHLPGAVNLPPDQVKQRAKQVIPDPSEEVVVYCANPSCTASEKAAQELEREGFTHVLRYVGGKTDWTQAGLPTEQGA
jgi:rhodanese-related sulfurtransferase